MPQVSRPLIGLLVASVLFLAVWMVALKPSSDSGAGSASNPTVYSPAITAAKRVAPDSPEAVSVKARATKTAKSAVKRKR